MDKLRKLYIDLPNWSKPIKTDDFLVAVGIKKSNSVYHVSESKPSSRKDKRLTRYHLKVYKSDLITALKRDNDQELIIIKWYSRNKKKH